jgi:eukaryotic-like serine/threonine-protein kinase
LPKSDRPFAAVRAYSYGVVAPLAPGDPAVVGAYRLVGRLGRGGMGTVYLGQPAVAAAPGVPDLRVAVKVVHPDLAADAGFRARFREEVAAARRVAPFCTARVVDADPHAAQPYLVTEYVDGVSLRQAVDERGPLDGSTLAGVALGVAAALAAIHAAGLVHRDLKPANVLLSLSGQRVIDFGIARALDSARRLTQVGTVLGTPGWMAPEQIAGGVVGPAADVFSWGSLVGYAATGRNPWAEGGGGPTALAYRVVHDAPDLAGLDGALRPLVELALRKEPAARPSARDLVLSLLGGTAAPGQPVPLADPAGAATAAATQLVRLGLGGTTAAPRAGPPGQPPPTAVMPPPTAVMPARTRALTRHPGGAPPPGPPPPPPYAYPHAYPPPRRKRRWYRKKRYLLPLAVLAVLLFSAARPDDPNDPGAGTVPSNRASGIGAPVRDGQLEFVLRSWRCGLERIGQPPRVLRPQGQYCVGRVEVRNIGDEPRTLYEPVQKLFDTNDREYHADFRARLVIDNQTLWEEVNPGNTVRGTMAFDVAEDATPERLEFHDGLLSGGATLRL